MKIRFLTGDHSTGRRKARRALYNAYVPYKCVGYLLEDGSRFICDKTTIEPPKDAPHHFDEIWPTELRVLEVQLEADHESKDFQNNELEYVNWKCKSCHRMDDKKTAKGVPQHTVNLWVE
jgi:hypothetical protein